MLKMEMEIKMVKWEYEILLRFHLFWLSYICCFPVKHLTLYLYKLVQVLTYKFMMIHVWNCAEFSINLNITFLKDLSSR